MLTVQIFRSSAMSEMLADYTYSGQGLSFGTNRHGFSELSLALVPMSLRDSFTAYEWQGLPHVVVTDHSAGVIWEGRLEDITIVDGGIALEALGYQRAMWDVPYTGLWSKTSTADWKPVTSEVWSGITPEKYEMDNNNRLYITPRKGEVFITANNVGYLSFALPHSGQRNIAKFTADYSITLPADWKASILSSDYDFANGVTEAYVNASGVNQTGSFNLTTSAKQRIGLYVYNDTGGNYTVAAETGAWFVRMINIRIKSTTTATVLASEIAAAMVTYVNSVNSDQLSSSTALIEATTTDLQDEIYEDELPADILDRLALLHGYEWGVYENRMLHFRTKGSAGRHWYVDATRIVELQRSLEPLRTAAYATYKDANGQTLRTAFVGSDSVDRYDITRYGVVDAQTTSATEAALHRDTFLADRREYSLRARVEFSRIYDAAGSEWPLYMMRAGDTVTIRNLPPTLSTSVDRIRTFIIGETDYDAARNEINIAPYEPVPTLVTLLARRDAGL